MHCQLLCDNWKNCVESLGILLILTTVLITFCQPELNQNNSKYVIKIYLCNSSVNGES